MCTGQNKDDMTYDMQITAQNMVNYYRRLVASGWAKDKNDYAPTATKMTPVAYDCDNIGKESQKLADNCDAQTYTPTGALALSYHKLNELNIPPAEFLEKAITTWADQVKQIELDKQVVYAGDVESKAKDFANMLNEKVTKVGCSVKVCQAKGFTVAVCQYDASLTTDDTVYTVGKPCKECNALGKKCDSTLGGGLCVTN
ncbi:SCP-like protein [Ancylostoma caninum]|uniref:SCP-like protein n=1 Tax=Ancylostoma caninum TaxID=29170 RepID=A0A368FBS2_ANCCA|nr:SCP-like protein [Ancylostoma caninum]